MKIGIDIDDVITNTSKMNKNILTKIKRVENWLELEKEINKLN